MRHPWLLLTLAAVVFTTGCVHSWRSYRPWSLEDVPPTDRFRIQTRDATYRVHAVRVVSDTVVAVRESFSCDTCVVRIPLAHVTYVQKWVPDPAVTGALIAGAGGLAFWALLLNTVGAFGN